MRAPASLVIVLAMSIGVVGSSGADAGACAADAFTQFDFWVGEWKVVDREARMAGRNVIALEQQGCVLVERWTSAKGGTGMSMNHYDPLSRKWKQHWVGLGLILEMSGGLRDGAMVLEGPLQYVAQKKVSLLRGTWSALPDGRVRQHFVESEDDGKSWTEWFDGYYTREENTR